MRRSRLFGYNPLVGPPCGFCMMPGTSCTCGAHRYSPKRHPARELTPTARDRVAAPNSATDSGSPGDGGPPRPLSSGTHSSASPEAEAQGREGARQRLGAYARRTGGS